MAIILSWDDSKKPPGENRCVKTSLPGGDKYIWEDLVTTTVYLFLPPEERLLLLLPDDLVVPEERLLLELGATVLLEGELFLDGAAVLLLGGVDLAGLVVDRLGCLLGGV